MSGIMVFDDADGRGSASAGSRCQQTPPGRPPGGKRERVHILANPVRQLNVKESKVINVGRTGCTGLSLPMGEVNNSLNSGERQMR